MAIYFSNKPLSKLFLGTREISKAYKGNDLVYTNSTPPSPSETLYLSNDNTVLNIGTSYDLPTSIYDIDTGTTTTTVTRLATILSIGTLNESSGSHSSGYYYTPVLEANTVNSNFTGGNGEYPSGNHLDVLSHMVYYKNTTKNLSQWNVLPTYINGNDVTSETTRITFDSSLIGQTIRCRFNFTPRSYSLVAGQPTATNPTISYTAKDSSGNILAQREKSTYYVTPPNYTTLNTNNNIMISFTVPSDRLVDITLKVDRTNETTPWMTWSDVGYSRMDAYLVTNYYDTPLYCNISRIQYVSDEYPEYNEDFVEVAINTTNTNATKMISISDQGIATLSDITNN